MKVLDVCAAMDEWAPQGLAYDWDRTGLAIGDPQANVKRALVALTVTREAFNAAVKAKAGIIVAHHPPIWEPFKTLRTDDPATRLCLDIAQAGMACFSAHTNLDLAKGGVNDVLADAIGLQDKQPLLHADHARYVKLVTFVPEKHLAKVRDAVCAKGAGVIGQYTHCSFSTPGTGTFLPGKQASPFSGKVEQLNEEPELRFEVLVPKASLPHVLKALFDAHPYEEAAYDVVNIENTNPSIALGVKGALPKSMTLKNFAKSVCKCLKIPDLKVVGQQGSKVRSVAVIGGAGGSQISKIPTGIDVLVTGDVSYHDALDAQQRGLAVIDAGHAETEKLIVPTIAKYLRKNLKNLSVSTYTEKRVFQTVNADIS